MIPLLLAAAETVGSGKISGGWEYVWAAYGVTWATLSLYALSLWARKPRAAKPIQK